MKVNNFLIRRKMAKLGSSQINQVLEILNCKISQQIQIWHSSFLSKICKVHQDGKGLLITGCEYGLMGTIKDGGHIRLGVVCSTLSIASILAPSVPSQDSVAR